MGRYNGSNILVIDPEWSFAVQLREALKFQGANSRAAANLHDAFKHLKLYDFDLIICPQFLKDGYFFELIDWCRDNLTVMPVFAVLTDSKKELQLNPRYSIAGVLHKSNSVQLFDDISGLLFSFERFKASLLEVLEESGVLAVLQVGRERLTAKPLEMSEKGIFLSLGTLRSPENLCILRISRLDKKEADQVFTLAGFLRAGVDGAQYFEIHENYLPTWMSVMDKFALRQLGINSFLKKASGL